MGLYPISGTQALQSSDIPAAFCGRILAHSMASLPGMASLPHISVDSTLGAAFIGNLLTAILYGLTCLQTYTVYQQKKDRVWIRAQILTLWAFATIHFVAVCSVLYYYLISNYSNPTAIATQDLWAATTYYVITGLMEFVIRGVFTFRVWKLSAQNWILTFTIVAMSLVDLAGSFAFAGKNLHIRTFPDISSISWLFYMAFGGSIAADLLTAVSLCYLLKKRSTGFRRTDSYMKVMMLYSVNTGALSSLCSLMVLVMYVAYPHNFIFVLFYFILPGVMLNSLLASMDASQRIWERSHNGKEAIVSIPMSTMKQSGGAAAGDSVIDIEEGVGGVMTLDSHWHGSEGKPGYLEPDIGEQHRGQQGKA